MRWLHNPFREALFTKRFAFFAILFFGFPVAVAYAGFFSFFDNIFSKVNTQAKTINSQNISLLAATEKSDIERFSDDDVNTVSSGALLPDTGPSGGLADISESDVDHGQISIYVVRNGDTLSSIASMFGVSVNTILWANDISRGEHIRVGQVLAILPVSGVQHTVKKGDTVQSIAKKYKGDPDEILTYNGLSSADTLEVGSVVIIPDGEMQIMTPPKTTRPATSKLRGIGGPSYDDYYHAPLSDYRKTQGLHGYNGVDLASYLGAPIMASAEGDVIISRQGGYNGGYGNYVVIKHGNGTQTLYAHLLSTAVSSGDHVPQGQVIGYLGNTGRSTGPHLHFEIRGARNPF